MEQGDGGGDDVPKVKAKPVQWTEAELDALHRALSKHGHKWTVIKQDPEFAALLWRPIKGLQSKWHTINPNKPAPGLSPGATKRKANPSSKKGGKPQKHAKRVSPQELLAHAFDTAPTLSELSVHSEAEEDEAVSAEMADSLVDQLMENEKGLGSGPAGLGLHKGEEAQMAEVGVPGETKEEERVTGHFAEGQGLNLGQASNEGNEGGGVADAELDLHKGEEAQMAVDVGVPLEPKEEERVTGDSAEAQGLNLGQASNAGNEGGGGAEGAVPMEMDGANPAEYETEGGLPTGADGGSRPDHDSGRNAEQGGAGLPGLSGIQNGGPENGASQAALRTEEHLGRPPNLDLNESHVPEEGFAGLDGFGGAEALPDEGHFEDAPDERHGGGERVGLSEIQPGGGMDPALGFFPEEELPAEEENAVLAAKRAEIEGLERKTRVLESKREAWMRAFEKKRVQYCARMADVETTCRQREAAQEEQRKVVYEEKWALEAARQTAAQLVQDLLALVPAPDNISIDRLHPSMSWDTTFGPKCILKREMIQHAFDKRQRAVGMLKTAALDAHRKKQTMARKLGLDVRDEALTEEALQQTPEFRSFNEKLEELRRQMEGDLAQLEERESAARGAWVAFQEKGDSVQEAEAKLKALLKEGQLKKSRGKPARKTM